MIDDKTIQRITDAANEAWFTDAYDLASKARINSLMVRCVLDALERTTGTADSCGKAQPL